MALVLGYLVLQKHHWLGLFYLLAIAVLCLILGLNLLHLIVHYLALLLLTKSSLFLVLLDDLAA